MKVELKDLRTGNVIVTKKLECSSAELEQFAYMTSHALQEPLHILSHYIQLLAQRYKGKFDTFDADANNIISHILERTTWMQKLINGLRAYSYVDRRGRPFEPTSCEAVLKQALNKRQATIQKSGGVITHESLPIVMADASQLVQLFGKLIGNAIKYRNEKLPRIHISAQRKENEWIFSVRDNGIGIAPEYQECIFLIFQRLHKGEEYPGNGTGLAICKRIVERHGGRIWVESKPGNGSTFYFTIPENLHVLPPL